MTQPRAIAVMLTLILLGAAVYAPGLIGDFIFDDFANIVDNSSLRPDAVTLKALASAALSSESGPLKRPLASLSFLANFHFFGPNPFSFKITNLVIHLLNGCLVFWFLRIILPRLLRQDRHALAVAGLTAIVWTVHPINLTGVLYIVQRMTSLAATFSLLAMICYVRVRERAIEEPTRNSLSLWGGVLIFALLGISTKESALLLPVFLALIEITTFRFRNAAYLKWFYAVGAVIVSVGLWYLLVPLDYFNQGYRARPFTAGERMLTELRILVFYLEQILLPNPTQMALLHTDWELSRNIWTPWTTAVAAGFWLLVIAGSLTLSKRYPILLFGIGWYLGGHLLESTVVPLDLVYEHRNYLPSVGILCLAILAVRRVTVANPAIGKLVTGGMIVILSVMTAYRAWQWSEPFTLALTEARHNPMSARARYEYGRRYFQLYQADRSPERLEVTRRELWAAVKYGNEDYQPLAGLVNTYVVSREPVPENLMQAYERELRDEVPTARRLDGVYIAINCQMIGACPPTPEVILRAVGASLKNPRLDPKSKAEVLEWLALYYANALGDLAAARAVIDDAVLIQPDNWTFRLRRLEVMAAQQDWPAIRQELAQLKPVLTPWARVLDPTLAQRFDDLERKLTVENQMGPGAR